MGHISLRIPDEDEQRLRESAQLQQIQFTAYLRQLLELGEQVGRLPPQYNLQPPSNKLTKTASFDHDIIAQAVLENRYLLRYLIGKLFNEEGQKAKKIAHTQAKKDTHNRDDE